MTVTYEEAPEVSESVDKYAFRLLLGAILGFAVTVVAVLYICKNGGPLGIAFAFSVLGIILMLANANRCARAMGQVEPYSWQAKLYWAGVGALVLAIFVSLVGAAVAPPVSTRPDVRQSPTYVEPTPTPPQIETTTPTTPAAPPTTTPTPVPTPTEQVKPTPTSVKPPSRKLVRDSHGEQLPGNKIDQSIDSIPVSRPPSTGPQSGSGLITGVVAPPQ